MDPTQRRTFLASLSDEEAAVLLYDWCFWARDNQLAPPGNWVVWLINAGRGFGKTRTGAEWIRARVESGRFSRIALVAETAADARDVMIEGESGILAISPPWCKPLYEPSKRQLTWPNGAIAKTYSAEDPEQLRGPQHDTAWCDELAKWRYADDTWSNLMFGLRIGPQPQACVTTTPRPTPLFKELYKDPLKLYHTVISGGSTYENAANLSPVFLNQVVKRYEGTRLGRQELEAALLEDTPGALWTRRKLDELRVTQAQVPDLVRVVVGVDPSASAGEESAETGIIAAGLGADGHGYVFADASLQGTPSDWGSAAIETYHAHDTDLMVGEINNGGNMIRYVIQSLDPNVRFKEVRASRGKLTRAEPVSVLYNEGRVHHVGTFPQLEDQMCEWVPGMDSPDRMDALVWALTELMVDIEPSKDAKGHAVGLWRPR